MTHLKEIVYLLQHLIASPSFSREEGKTAAIIQKFFTQKNIPTERIGNNIIVKNKYYCQNSTTPIILLNSHHDTVKPVNGWTRDPFSADIIDGKLYGLGSNDAGGALVSLIATFCFFYDKNISGVHR